MEGEDIVKFIKAKRLRWFRHVLRKSSKATIRKINDLEGRTKRKTNNKMRRPSIWRYKLAMSMKNEGKYVA